MKYCKPSNRLAFRRLAAMELRRSARSLAAVAACGIVLPAVFVALVDDMAPALVALAALAVLAPVMAAVNSAKDRYTGDLEFLGSLPVGGHVHGASRLVVLLLLALVPTVLVAPYLWSFFASLEGWGAAGFAAVLIALCGGSWTMASLFAAVALRFRTERFAAWALGGFVLVAFAGDRLLTPVWDALVSEERLAAVVAWALTPWGIAVSCAGAGLVAAGAIALSLRWMRTAIETHRREDHIFKL